tara:strand:+ start:257 stop:454 length:198 start_codon:yes stop_codon:yes gene_type:complete
MKLVIDVETNGFLNTKLDFKVHCMVCKDMTIGKVYSYNPDQLNYGLQLLMKRLVSRYIQSLLKEG